MTQTDKDITNYELAVITIYEIFTKKYSLSNRSSVGEHLSDEL